jgi:membrane-associated protease RseP (regulator of RpoE activity)
MPRRSPAPNDEIRTLADAFRSKRAWPATPAKRIEDEGENWMSDLLKPLGHAAAVAAGFFVLSIAFAGAAASGQAPSADLGISINPGQVGPVPGAYVVGVRAGTAAAEAGLRAGDLVIAADGERLSGPASLPQRLSRHRPGDAVPLEVLRDGRLLGATLHVPAVEAGSSSPPPPPAVATGTRRAAPHGASSAEGTGGSETAGPKAAHRHYSVGGMGVGYHEP